MFFRKVLNHSFLTSKDVGVNCNKLNTTVALSSDLKEYCSQPGSNVSVVSSDLKGYWSQCNKLNMTDALIVSVLTLTNTV